MEFKQPRAIYLQIADYICEQILREELKVNEKVPSVRDLAMLVEVNPNTIVRTYSFLEENGIIYKERGLGYFVAPNGYANALKMRQDYFLNEFIPFLFKNLKILHIDIPQLEKMHDEYLKTK